MRELLWCVPLFISLCAGASAQTSNTAGEFWPEVDADTQLPSNLRLLLFEGLEKGQESQYQQLFVGGGLGYQLKPILRPHLINIDQDKEHYLVVGGGYEYLRTIQSGKATYENRLAVEAIPRYRPPAGFLLEDRNRAEFRWVNGQYSTRYRNQLTVERDFRAHNFRFTPYASAEAYYDGAKHSWNEEQYTGGIQFPYRRLLMLDTYYLRQDCTTCNPEHLNVAGLTLSFFFRNKT
ncbi:MAG TPA: DUF2490 domain-containing protein [Terriglobia bacterium]